LALYNLGFNQQVQVDKTTTPLGANGTYTTATPINCGGNARITGTVYSDKAGTLYIDFSPDGTNWDYSTTAVSVSAGTGTGFSEEVVAPYARLRYVNGATAQTTFRLYAYTRGI
jgi:hypothetical protein